MSSPFCKLTNGLSIKQPNDIGCLMALPIHGPVVRGFRSIEIRSDSVIIDGQDVFWLGN